MSFFRKSIAVIISALLVVGASVGVSYYMQKNNAVPVSVENGLSAYELAVQYGYEGSVQEWLESLNGKSAYEIAKNNGYSGTEAEWIASLKATAGKKGVGIKTAAFSAQDELIITLTDDTVLNLGVVRGKDGVDGINGKDGAQGTQGEQGTKGEKGEDGVSITSANINADGQLVLAFSDGKTFNLDKVVGMNGQDGISVLSSEINSAGELVITYSNNQTANLGVVVGAKGEKGDKGETGATGATGAQGEQGIQGVQGEKGDKGDTGAQGIQGIQGEKGDKGDKGDTGVAGQNGVSVTKTEINQKGELVITLSDNTVSNLGVVIGAKGDKGDKGDTGATGEKGDKGDQGIQGVQGNQGEQGISVSGAEINSNGNLVLYFSNGQRTELGNVIGAKGDKGDTGATGAQGVQGIQGEKGDQGIQGIKGEKGDKGDKGDTGAAGKDGVSVTKTEINQKGELVITLSDNTVSNLGVVVGAKGDKGDKGDTGAQGEKGEKGDKGDTGAQGIQGIQGEQGIQGIQGEQGVGIETIVIDNGNLKITLTNGTNLDLGNIKGEKGDKGDTGATGAKGEQGIQGVQGVQGVQGETGNGIASATINGYGELVIVYTNGDDVNLGNVIGAKGDKGDQGIQGEIGAKGDKGDKGDTGAKGDQGVGVESININADGELEIKLTDSDNIINLGKIIGPQGAQGIQGEKGEQGAQGIQGKQGIQGEKGDKGDTGTGVSKVVLVNDELIITLSDSTVINLGNVRGVKGEKGDKGDQGVSITNVTLTIDGELSVTLSSGATISLGNVKGADGQDGVGIEEIYIQDGCLYVKKTTDAAAVNLGSIKGDKGDTGEQGVDGKSAYELYKQLHPEYTGTLEDWLNSLKGETGRGILRTEFSGTNFVIYYTDGTSETHDLSDMFGDPNDREILVFSKLSDGTYGVMAGGMAKYEAKITIPATYNDVPVTQILSNGFKDLTALQKIEMPNSIKVIGKSAFQGCTGLNNLVLPSALKEINQYAFNDCVLLSSDIVIPETTKLIGKYAFYGTALTSVTLEDNTGWITEPIRYTCNSTEIYTSSISAAASTMTNFSITNAVTNSSSSSDKNQTYSLTPQKAATALTTRVHQSYVYSWGWDSVTKYYWHFDAYNVDWENPTVIDDTIGYTEGLEYTLLSNGTYAVSLGTTTDKNIIIPPSYNGISVTQIKENGFKGITDLESVVIPEGITVIGDSAFSGCTMLEISIPESTKSIKPSALYNVKTITVSGTNSWSVSGAYTTRVWAGNTMSSGTNGTISSTSLSATNYSDVRKNYIFSDEYTTVSPWTGTWSR